MKKNVLLYFGSFNPVHRGHIALAEYAVERGLCDEVVLVVSPQSPLKEAAGLAPELSRFEMAEAACAASRYPDRIKASAVEFLLDRPSYTIRTLEYLEEHHGADMRFSLLMGADTAATLGRWLENDRIVGRYIIYVYPREGAETPRDAEGLVVLEDAPLLDCSSTAIREAVERGEDVADRVGEGVAAYIRRAGLWNPVVRMQELTQRIDAGDASAEAYVERGRLHFRRNEWGKALNDFRAALRLEPDHREAAEYVDMVEEILAFRYIDIYNP